MIFKRFISKKTSNQQSSKCVILVRSLAPPGASRANLPVVSYPFSFGVAFLRPKRRTKEGSKKGLLFTFFITSSSAGGRPAGSFRAGCDKWPGGLVF